MLRKPELQSYIRTRSEGYPDDEARLRGIIAGNLIRLIEHVEEAAIRKQDARTEIESLDADKAFAKYQLSLEENWREFKHLFEPEAPVEHQHAKPLVDVKTEDTLDILDSLTHRVQNVRSSLAIMERDISILRSMHE